MSAKPNKENDFLSGSSCSNGGELDKLLTFRDAPVTDRRKKYRSRKLATATNAPQFLALPRTVQNLRVIPSPVTHQTLARSAASDQRSALLRQTQQPGDLSEVPDSEEDIERSSGSEPARKRPRHSLDPPYATYHGLPTELKFYPKTWVDILEHAKDLFLVWLITKCPWPQREIHLVNAEHSLIAAIDTYRGKDRNIEEGYYPTYKREMSTLIFEESFILHEALFKRARQIAKEKYDLYPDWTGGFGQAAYEQYVSMSAKELVDSSEFMHHGHDNQGKKNNFNHLALEELCAFFYGSADSVGILSPEETGDALPHNALALACEALHCSLKELIDGVEYTFSPTPTYRGMHSVLMGLIDKTDRDVYHGPKLRRSLKEWAYNGRIRCKVHWGSSQTYGLQVYLD